MNFTETKLPGAYIIEPEKLEDERGFFARTFCKNEFEKYGLNTNLVQCNISFNKKAGTLRGMHFQLKPFQEAKLVRCTRGTIYDVIIDLRQDSPTYCQWLAIELNEENYKVLYIPEGFAHGFMTLADNTEVFYQMNQFFQPEASGGIRWDDSYFKIDWPDSEKIISQKDREYPDFRV